MPVSTTDPSARVEAGARRRFTLSPAARQEYRAARQLLRQLVRRDLRVQHRGTALGNLWSLITPILTVGVYTFVFTVIMPSSPIHEGVAVPFAVYLFVGLTIWNLLQNSVLSGTGSVLGAGYLLSKVYFRREILPLTSVLSALVTFCWEFGVAIVVVTFVVGWPSWTIIFVPLVVAVVAILGFGIALLLSTATVFYRDVQHFVAIAMQVWFWGSPIIYSTALLKDRPNMLRILELNPMTGILESLRSIMLEKSMPDWALLGYAGAMGLVFVGVGMLVFRHNERLFAEMI
jgi:ABC-2 type transport system permease protein